MTIPMKDEYRLKYADYGVIIDHVDLNIPGIFITVPESTDFNDKDGTPICGSYLAKIVKNEGYLSGLPSNCKILWKERKGDHWNKAKSNQCNIATRACIELGNEEPMKKLKEYFAGKTNSIQHKIFDSIKDNPYLNKERGTT